MTPLARVAIIKCVTSSQRSLLMGAAAFVPVVFGWVLPGGATGDVELGFEEIAVRTWPWTASIAGIVWLLLRNPHGEAGAMAAGVAACLGLGAFLALAFVPAFELTTSQAASPMYWLVSEARPEVAVRAAQLGAHNPRATLAVVAVSLVAVVFLAYALLYGPALWLAGIAAGAVIGWMLNEAFPRKA